MAFDSKCLLFTCLGLGWSWLALRRCCLPARWSSLATADPASALLLGPLFPSWEPGCVLMTTAVQGPACFTFVIVPMVWGSHMAGPCVWVNSRSLWWTGRPGMLRFMGSQRVRHDWVAELNWTELRVEAGRDSKLPGKECGYSERRWTGAILQCTETLRYFFEKYFRLIFLKI